MEVKIGVTDVSRELMIASSQSQEEIEALIDEALSSSNGQLRLSDEKGRRFVVPSSKVAYVEIGAQESQRVGFGVG